MVEQKPVKKRTEISQNFSTLNGKVVLNSGEELVGPEGVWKPTEVRKERRKGITRRGELADVARKAQDETAEAIELVPEMDAPEGEVVSEKKVGENNKEPKIDGLPHASVIKRRQDRANIEPIPPIEFDQAKG
jgi:hypothetical protein